MSRSFFTSNSDRGIKTNKLSKFLLVLFLIIVPMIVFWLLFGQLNLLGLNWMVPMGGKFYQTQGMVNNLLQQNVYFEEIIDGQSVITYPEVGFVHYNLSKLDLIDKYIKAFAPFGINPTKPIFNPLVLAPTLGLLGLNIVIFILLSLFAKSIYIDIFPSGISSWLGMFTLIMAGMIPEDSHSLSSGAKIPIVMICIIVAWVGSIILLNLLFNKLIIDSKHADVYYEKLLKETREENLAKKEIKSKQLQTPETDESTVVEVIEEDNKN